MFRHVYSMITYFYGGFQHFSLHYIITVLHILLLVFKELWWTLLSFKKFPVHLVRACICISVLQKPNINYIISTNISTSLKILAT